MNISKLETCIRGEFRLVNGVPVADENCNRIYDLLKNSLKFMAEDESGWNRLYFDPIDGRFWELTYPDSASHGGGAPMLSEISEYSAKARFIFS